MGYFADVPDFADMSGAELAAELREAEHRAEHGETVLERSSGRIHADVIRFAIARHGLRPSRSYLSKRTPRRAYPFRPKGQYAPPV